MTPEPPAEAGDGADLVVEDARAVEAELAAEADDGAHGGLFWAGLALGGAVMAFAVRGILEESDAANPPELARWLVGAALLHDLLLAPALAALGVLLARLLPDRLRGPVVAAAALSALVAVYSIPLVRGFGLRSGNPSALPLDYGTNLVIVLVGIWLVALVVVAWRWRREST